MKVRLEVVGNPLPEARRAVRPQLEKIGREILDDAVRAAPVDTGNLKASGGMDVTDEQLTVGFTADYAEFVSDGTSRMQGNPFFKAALLKPRDGR